MSTFALTADESRFVARVREIARDDLAPLAEAAGPGRVNRRLVEALGERGLLAELFGDAARPAGDANRPGPAGDAARPGPAAMRLCLLREALATVSTEAETALALQGLGGHPLLSFGTDEVAARWRAPIVAGTAVAAFALSEPGAGSDAGALQLRAEPDGDGWRLTGEKMWISNAPEADVYSVFARTTPEAGARGVTAFVVPGDAPGLTGEHLDMLAPHAIGRLVFDGTPVSRGAVIGDIDAGFRVAMRTLDLFRPSVGAAAVGMGQAALDATIEHTKQRQAFGGRLADQQAVSHLLADMATRLAASRLLVYAAAGALDSGEPAARISSRSAMAKLYATESAQFIVDTAVQLHGARALRRGHLLEHLYREVRAPRIYEGASEIQRTIIGRALTRP